MNISFSLFVSMVIYHGRSWYQCTQQVHNLNPSYQRSLLFLAHTNYLYFYPATIRILYDGSLHPLIGETLPPPQVRVEGASDLALSSFQGWQNQHVDDMQGRTYSAAQHGEWILENLPCFMQLYVRYRKNKHLGSWSMFQFTCLLECKSLNKHQK